MFAADPSKHLNLPATSTRAWCICIAFAVSFIYGFACVPVFASDLPDKELSDQEIQRILQDRKEKLKQLTQIAKQRPPAANSLKTATGMLKDRDLFVQAHAAACLLSSDAARNDATNVLSRLLMNRDASVREEAALSAGEAKSGALSVVKDLNTTLMGDISPKVRVRAAWAIGQIGQSAAASIPVLLEALQKKHPLQDYHGRGIDGMDETIYKTCIASLGQIGSGSTAACAALAKLLEDGSKKNLQNDAIHALANMSGGASPAIPILIMQLPDAATARKVAILGLFKGMGAAAAPALPQVNDYIHASDPILRRAALDTVLAIDKSEKNKQKLLATIVDDPDAEIKKRASAELSSSTAYDPESLKALINTASTGDNEERLASIKTLGNYGKLAEDALPMLVKTNVATSCPAQQRKAAFDAIRRIDPSGAKTIPLLLNNFNDAFKVRAAIELLEYIDSAQTARLAKSLRAKWHM